MKIQRPGVDEWDPGSMNFEQENSESRLILLKPQPKDLKLPS